jgi:hypothetical protein
MLAGAVIAFIIPILLVADFYFAPPWVRTSPFGYGVESPRGAFRTQSVDWCDSTNCHGRTHSQTGLNRNLRPPAHETNKL